LVGVNGGLKVGAVGGTFAGVHAFLTVMGQGSVLVFFGHG
jgi:hypothetical protein